MTPNQSLQLTAGRCDEQLFYDFNIQIRSKARSRQRWLSSVSLGASHSLVQMEPLHPMEKLGGAIALFAFIGLGASKLARLAMGLSETDFMHTSVGAVLIWTLAFLFIIGLGVLFPVGVYLRTRKPPIVPHRAMPWWGVFVIPLGLSDPDWKIPPWVHVPLRVIMVVGFFALLFVIIMAYVYGR